MISRACGNPVVTENIPTPYLLACFELFMFLLLCAEFYKIIFYLQKYFRNTKVSYSFDKGYVQHLA